MNEHDPLEETFAVMRQTRPPAWVRDANRAAMREALSGVSDKRWWRRSIAVPLPLALITAAALVISVTTRLLDVRQGIMAPTEPDVSGESTGADKASATTLVATAGLRTEYSESQRYLSGVGVIDRNVHYGIKD